MTEEKKLFYFALYRRCEKWQMFYVGLGVGFLVCDYSIFHKMTTLTGGALVAFAMAMLNYHVTGWAKKKWGGQKYE